MNVRAYWLNASKNVIMMTYDNDWNWSHHNMATSRVQMMLDSVNHPVDLIIDVSKLNNLPERFIAHLPEITRFTLSPKIDQLVVVGLHGILLTAAHIYTRSYRGLIAVDTLDEANRLVKH